MNLRDFLTANQMRLSTFATKAGLKQSYASLIKNGHKRPSPGVALRIEEATGGAVTRMELLYPEQTNGSQPKA
jgi:DNA-binding transcriptional regulator YdaS (Cro superfamily)